jgi:MFS family permease
MSIAGKAGTETPSLANLNEGEKVIFAKIAWRILPLLSLAYIINFIDRNNAGFAGLTMIKDIGITQSEFGFGVGVLSAGYCLFEVPSNIALYKFGARVWLARIMITWGVISMAMMFAQGAFSFSALRFLLGAAEAGFFPGAAFYLTLWFPAEYRARIYAWFLISIPASTLVAGPTSSLLLELDQWLGLAGWKWLFLFEGLPAVVVGILFLIFLSNRPQDANWLVDEEKRIVANRIGAEKKEREKQDLWQTLKDPRVLVLALTQFTFLIGSYGVTIFLPLILKSQNFSNFTVGFLAAIPAFIACVAMIVWAGAVDRSGRKINNLIYTCLLSFVGMIVAGYAWGFIVPFLGLTAVLVGTSTARAILWTIPTRFLSGIGSAGGLAFINSVGTLGGFVGPYIMGWTRDATGSYSVGILAMAGFMFISMLLGLSLKLFIKQE